MSHSELPKRSRIVLDHLQSAGLEANIQELPVSTRTAAQAANALDCEVGAIASSLLFDTEHGPVLVMTSGRHRVEIELLSNTLGVTRVQMASVEQVREVTGQAIGGVAPTGHPAPIRTVVDVALRDYETIWTAAGTPNTVVPLTYTSLLQLTKGIEAKVAND